MLDLALVRPMGVAGTAWGDDYRAGSLWIPVSLLYEKKIQPSLLLRERTGSCTSIMCLICAIWESRWDCSIQITAIGSVILQTAVKRPWFHCGCILLRLPVKFPCSAAARSTRSAPLWRRMPDRTSVRRRWIVSTPDFDKFHYWSVYSVVIFRSHVSVVPPDFASLCRCI